MKFVAIKNWLLLAGGEREGGTTRINNMQQNDHYRVKRRRGCVCFVFNVAHHVPTIGIGGWARRNCCDSCRIYIRGRDGNGTGRNEKNI